MKTWRELKVQKDLDEFLEQNKDKTYMEMIKIFDTKVTDEREGQRQSNVDLLELFLKNYEDNYLKELKATDDIKQYYGLSVENVEEKINKLNKQKSKFKGNRSKYLINTFKLFMKIDALDGIRKAITNAEHKLKELEETKRMDEEEEKRKAALKARMSVIKFDQ